MYSHIYEVRYDECNLFGYVTPAAILRYLQDTAGLDAERVPLGQVGTWVARRTVVEFGSLPIAPRTRLEIKTYPLSFSRVTAHRAYDLYRLEDPTRPALRARTIWVFLDERGRPARLPASFQSFWLTPDFQPAPHPEADWPAFPSHLPYSFNQIVRFSDLDVLGHMNNTAYVELLDNAVWQAFESVGLRPGQTIGYPVPLHYDIEYLESGQAGDNLTVEGWFEPTPSKVGEVFRLERILRDGKTIVRARSRWQWQAGPGPTELGRL